MPQNCCGIYHIWYIKNGAKTSYPGGTNVSVKCFYEGLNNSVRKCKCTCWITVLLQHCLQHHTGSNVQTPLLESWVRCTSSACSMVPKLLFHVGVPGHSWCLRIDLLVKTIAIQGQKSFNMWKEDIITCNVYSQQYLRKTKDVWDHDK